MFEPEKIQTAEDLITSANPELLEWVRSVALSGVSWFDFRRLHKLAERTRDPVLIAEFLLRVDSEPLGRTGTPTRATIGYFKRRGRRFLRRLAKEAADEYADIGLRILSRAGLGFPSLPDHCWVTYYLLFGGRKRRRVEQARHGRGRYRLLSLRPTVRQCQDAFPAQLFDTEQRFRIIAENALLPWQTLEAAAIRLRRNNQEPEPSRELCRAFLESPSPLLHQLAAKHLASGLVAWAEIDPVLIAKCCTGSAARARRNLIRTIANQDLSSEWRASFVATVSAYLASANNRGHARRCVDALELLVTISAGYPHLLDSDVLAQALSRYGRDTSRAMSRVFAKCHRCLPNRVDFFLPFISSPIRWLRCVGWWLITKRLLSPASRGELWAKFIARAGAIVESTLTDPVAVATAKDSIDARLSIASYLVERPSLIVRILQQPASPARLLALTALKRPPGNVRELLHEIQAHLHGENLKHAIYTLLEGLCTRKHYSWVLEYLATCHSHELRGFFWQWCCEACNRDWLHDHLPVLAKHANRQPFETFAGHGNVALRLAVAGIIDLGVSWSKSVTKALKGVAKSGRANELIELLAVVPDKHWAGCERAVARRLSEDQELNATFWEIFFKELQRQHKGLDRASQSDALAGTLAAVVRPTFLHNDTEAAVPLIDHWIAANPSALDDEALILEVASNRNIRVRRHAIRRLQELQLDLSAAIRLLETGLPDACALGTTAVEKLWQTGVDREAMVLELVDSPTAAARNLGWQMFMRLYEAGEAAALVPQLAENEDHGIVANLVGLLSTGFGDDRALAAIAERVLLTPSSGRASKEALKRLITTRRATDDSEFLQRVAHGAAKRDREWAIEQLVAIGLAGKAADGVEIAREGFV